MVKCSLSGLSVLGVGARYGFSVCWCMFLSRRFAKILRLVSVRFTNLDSRSVVSRLCGFVGGLSGCATGSGSGWLLVVLCSGCGCRFGLDFDGLGLACGFSPFVGLFSLLGGLVDFLLLGGWSDISALALTLPLAGGWDK